MAEPMAEHKVRRAKELLIQGVSAVRIARLLDCSVETIRRYKRGESRVGVVVAGEEVLRPPLDLEGLMEPGQGEVKTAGADESLARLMAGLNGVTKGGVE